MADFFRILLCEQLQFKYRLNWHHIQMASQFWKTKPTNWVSSPF